MSWEIIGYQDRQGRQPVNEFILSLPPKGQARIRWTLSLLQEFGLALGMPYAQLLRSKLWELRVQSGVGDYRILYFAHVGRRFVLLHGFAKKTQKTPEREMEVAERRLTDYLVRCKEE